MKKLTALFICAAMFCGLALCVPDISATADTSDTLTVIEIPANGQTEVIDLGAADKEQEENKLLYKTSVENVSETTETQTSFVKKEPVKAVLNTFKRGETVKIVGEKDDMYIITDDFGNRYFAEKKFIRTDEESKVTAPADFYTAAEAKAFSSAYLDGDPAKIFKVNDVFRVEDELNGVYYGSYEKDGIRVYGYIAEASISDVLLSTFAETDGFVAPYRADIYDNPELEGTPIKQVIQRAHIHVYEQVGNSLRIKVTDESISAYGTEGYIAVDDFTEEAPAIKWDPSMAKGSGGGGGGGAGGGGGGPAYGQDIMLGFRITPADKPPVLVPLAAVIAQSVEDELDKPYTEGTVFTDGLELIAALYEKGDEVRLIEKTNDIYWTVLVGDKVCTILSGTVRLEGEPEEPEMEEQDAFIAEGGAKIYDNPELAGEPIKQAAARVKIHIYEQVGDALRIKVTSETVSAYGVEGYISIDEYTADRPEIKWDPSMARASGGGGGGDGGGSDWSVPVL